MSQLLCGTSKDGQSSCRSRSCFMGAASAANCGVDRAPNLA